MRPLNRIVEELAPEYLAARRSEVPEMLRLLAASDFNRLRILSHSLKGSFGFPELTRFGAALEQHASRSDPEAFEAELVRLKAYLDQLNLDSSQLDESSLDESNPARGVPADHAG